MHDGTALRVDGASNGETALLCASTVLHPGYTRVRDTALRKVVVRHAQRGPEMLPRITRFTVRHRKVNTGGERGFLLLR